MTTRSTTMRPPATSLTPHDSVAPAGTTGVDASVGHAPTEPTSAAHAPLDADARRERVHHVLGRLAYWAPVFVALVLFGQVSFLGLRPALAEAGRLNEAEGVLATRHEAAVEHNTALMSHLAARQDPIFLERQRRQRAWATTPSVANSSAPATNESSVAADE